MSTAMSNAPLSPWLAPGRRQSVATCPAGPVLDPLPCVVETRDDDHARVNPLPGRRDAQQGSAVGTLKGEPATDTVALGHHFFDQALQVRYAFSQGAGEQFQAVQGGAKSGPTEWGT